MVAQIIQKIDKIDHRKKKFFWFLFSLFICFVMSYGFLLNCIMVKASSKQNIEKDMVLLGSEVNSLESNYLNIKNSITLSLAQSKGFVSVPSDKFAVTDSTQKKLSLSINEN